MRCLISPRDPKTHRMVVERPPHPPVDEVLETRSLLLHDLAHYAVESALGSDDGFYGRIAAGWSPEALRDGTLSGEAYDRMMAIEGQVAMLQTAFKKGRGGPQDLGWSTLRAVWGAWGKVGSGERLVLPWPPGDPSVEPNR